MTLENVVECFGIPYVETIYERDEFDEEENEENAIVDFSIDLSTELTFTEF